MIKIYDKNNSLINILILWLVITSIYISYQYIFGYTIYCDNYIEIIEPSFANGASINEINAQTSNVNVLTELQERETLNNECGDRNSNLINAKCLTIYVKYENIIRRKVFWYTCIKSKGIYENYNNYKQEWDPNTKVLSEIRKELNEEIKDELHKIRLKKRTFDWIIKPSTRGHGRGGNI